MSSKTVKKEEKPEPTPVPGSNANPDYDALVAEGSKVATLWNKADKAQGSADAHAVILMVRAHEFGFFDTVNVANWHKIATAKQRNAFANVVLSELFGIDAPDASDRQRLQRIKLVVPAVIKAGGTKVATLSSKGAILLDVDTKYFKACPTGGIEAGPGSQVAVSIAKLARGGNKWLDKEIARSPRAAQAGDSTTVAVPKAKLVELAQITTGKVRALSDGAASLDNPTSNALQALLVQLMDLFAADTAGGIDTAQLDKMYKAA